MSAFLSQLIGSSAQQYGVPPSLLAAQLQQESGLNPFAVNPSSGAAGIAQFMPSTAGMFGIDPFQPQQAVPAAASYMSQLYQRTGSWLGALTAYGTLPSNPSSYTQSQSALAQLASSLDGQGGFWNPGAALAPNGNLPPEVQGLQNSPLGGALTSTPLGVIGQWVERALIVLVGLAVLYGGIHAFGTETSMGRQAARAARHVSAGPRAALRAVKG